MNEEQKKKNPPDKKRNPLVSMAVIFAGLASTIWLFIPEPTDIIPLAGWIDEAAAVAIIASCFAYFGIDIKGIFGRFGKGAGTAGDDAKQAKGEVIDSDKS